MALKTPDWWYKRDAQGAPWWRFALWPLSQIWLWVNAIKRLVARPYRSNVFVISVGNLTLGGSGKTPITAEILRLLGASAVGLSKGYGGTLSGPVLVDPSRHTALQVGDEPLMLAQTHDFVIARDRAAGLMLIESTHTDVAVVDDAHQNLKIVKDLHILVVDGDTQNNAWPFGDQGICPYGPMREPLGSGLARADIVILWLPDHTSQPDPALLRLIPSKPVFIARLTAEPAKDRPHVVGFAAIAKPWKFEATLRAQGYEVIDFEGFPDHLALTNAQLQALKTRADSQLSDLITTQKDWVKLSPEWRETIKVLPITARFDDETGFRSALMAAVKAHPAR